MLNAVGALLPAYVLMPMAERIGRIKTHVICMAFMTAGYVILYLSAKTIEHSRVCFEQLESAGDGGQLSPEFCQSVANLVKETAR